jgi:F420-dependent oxidoreductase-like protein
MRIHRNGGGHHHSIDGLRDAARETVEDGLAGLWLSQVFALDSLTALAVIAADTPTIELGTSVVPIYGRHPMVLAMQALTAQTASGGRAVLGIGPSHKLVVEMLLGGSYDRPYSDTADYIDALLPLLRGGGAVTIDAPAPPVLLAALGPRMLRLAADKADGVALWMMGPKTIASRVEPIVDGKRILAGISVCVTDNVPARRARAAEEQKVYGTLPACQAVLAAEGVSAPEDLLIAGDEDQVASGIDMYEGAGVTDVRVTILSGDADEHERTRALLRRLA